MTKSKVFYWLPPAVWAMGIFALSCISLPPKPPLFPHQDKAAHFVLYAVLAILLYQALLRERRFSPWKSAILAFVLTSLYGVTDELHQLFTPMRSCDVMDWIADTVAGGLAFIFAFVQKNKV